MLDLSFTHQDLSSEALYEMIHPEHPQILAIKKDVVPK